MTRKTFGSKESFVLRVFGWKRQNIPRGKRLGQELVFRAEAKIAVKEAVQLKKGEI